MHCDVTPIILLLYVVNGITMHNVSLFCFEWHFCRSVLFMHLNKFCKTSLEKTKLYTHTHTFNNKWKNVCVHMFVLPTFHRFVNHAGYECKHETLCSSPIYRKQSKHIAFFCFFLSRTSFIPFG